MTQVEDFDELTTTLQRLEQDSRSLTRKFKQITNMKKNRSKSMSADFSKQSKLEVRKRLYRRALQLYEQKRREQEL